MQSHFEESLRQDIDQIRGVVVRMGGLAEGAFRTAIQALERQDRHLAETVILKDRYIDELENELDLLCLRFLVKHQPAAGHLRLAYSIIKINNQLERTGDYAESIARQFLVLSEIQPQPLYDPFIEIAELAIKMLHNAVQAFADNDTELAVQTRAMEKDRTVDRLRSSIHDDLIRQHKDHTLPSEALVSLMTIANRCERIADQAGNICEELVYIVSGEELKHSGKEVIRVLFVDKYDAFRSQIAEGIGNSLGLKEFMFASAGLTSRPVDQKTVRFMAEKGIDISHQTGTIVDQILNIEGYQSIIALCKEAETAFPPPSSKAVTITWEVQDPSGVEGNKEEMRAAYEQTYEEIDSNIKSFVQPILGHSVESKEGV